MALADARRGLPWRLRVPLAVAALLAPLASAVDTAAAACALAPVLRDVTTQQGLGSQPVLVRGKEALAKLYLSLPSCAGTSSSVAVTAATLSVSAGGTSTTIRSYRPAPGTTPAPLVPKYAAAPALDAVADPTFVVPGSTLAPTSTTARFTASFSATVTWSAKSSSTAAPVTGTTTFRTRPGSTAPITATVEKRTNALRLLFVPMGNAGLSYAEQFPESARTATVSGVNTLSRIFPVPAGVSDLAATSSTAGVRYAIAPTLLDVGKLTRADGKFCGSQTNFDAVKGALGQFMLSWNTANPNTPADRVVGVVADAVSLGGSAGCADGMAAMNGTQAWVRALPDAAGAPSPTGALMGMELGHTFGMVPATRDAFADLFHSPYTAADTSAPNRAFNTTLRSFLVDDKSVMTMSGTWNNAVTLLEPADWSGTLCRLGGATTADCTVPGTVGTATGVGAEPTFVMSGTTDGHDQAGTSLVESYWAPSVPRTTPDPASPYRLVQRSGNGQVLRDDGVTVTFSGSDHHDGAPAGGTHPVGVFTLAVPFNTGADRIELWSGSPGSAGSTLLYARDRSAPPSVASTSVTTTPGGGGGGGFDPALNQRVSQDGATVGNGHTYTAAVSGDGRFVVFTSASNNLVPGDSNGVADVFVRDLTTGAVDRVNIADGGAQANAETHNHPNSAPSVSDDGRYVAFTSEASNLVPDDTNGGTDVFVRDRISGTTTRVSRPDSGSEFATNRSTYAPVISGDGSSVAFVSDRFDLVAGDTNNQPDVFLRDLTGGGLLERVSIGDDEAQPNSASFGPSLSDDGRFVAFSSWAANLVADDTNGIADVFVRDRQADTTERVSVDSSGAQASGDQQNSGLETTISDDGALVGFSSTATDLTGGDNNDTWDAFLHDRETGATRRISDSELFDGAYLPSLSGDGQYVGFSGRSWSPDSGWGWRAYVLALSTDDLQRAISRTSGDDANDVGAPSLSDDGGRAVMTANTTDLVGDGEPFGISHAYASTRADAGPPLPAGQEQVSVVATDDHPEDQRLDLLYRCPDGTASPVAVGLVPTEIDAGSASWATNFDASLGCEGGDLVTRVNDGFDLATAAQAGSVPAETSGPGVPIAAITRPAATVLQFEGVVLDGSGRDAEDGTLGGSALSWAVTGPGTNRQGSGGHVDLLPSSRGWSAGTYVITLNARDSSGRTGTDTATFTVLPDADHDGLPPSADVRSCGGTSADADPSNAYADPDGDGVPSRDDYSLGGTAAVCVARTAYDAQLTLSSLTATTGVLKVRVPYRDLRTVSGPSIRVTDISGRPVTFRAAGWSVSGGVGTARFDVRPIRAFLAANGMTDSQPVVTVTGSGTAAGRPWTFRGLVSYPPR
ncbi:MAG: domain protein beta Propeller [Blastococcus sp.]|jgi:Tol biopolymer transport system component|nr:domain protein beta Propeller [Blastococcus sp.]